jgi:hypothetical protein
VNDERQQTLEPNPVSDLRPGSPVWIRGREASFLYARRKGAVVRYRGERQSRVVSLANVARSPIA